MNQFQGQSDSQDQQQGSNDTGADPSATLWRDYRAIANVADEMIGADGAIKPLWAPFLASLSTMSADDLQQRHARADRYLSDAGVFYRQYEAGQSTMRSWPLAHMPVLIDDAEWQALATGLSQRAALLERVVADIYGDNKLVAGGHLPASLIAGNPEWLRPLVGVKPRGGHFLHFLAFDIGRGPNGKWWVLGDRTQAPAGAGFALENRIATTRAYSGLAPQLHIRRLAGFFRQFREALLDLPGAADGRVAILSPGPHNDSYFEHAYIARYLGFPLLEGEDLTIRDGALMVRTVEGPRPISVLWRRLDANWADPLELNGQSQIGTPGLAGAIANGSATMVNALGSGILETRAFLAFMPRISELLDSQPLAIPNSATWWCGGAEERAYVAANAAQIGLSNAFSTSQFFETEGAIAPQDRAAMITAKGASLIGQEPLQLSTTPAFHNGQLVPRPMSLRVFLARTANGWEVMPGGYARIGRDVQIPDFTPELALQRGGAAADVWVVSDKPVPSESMFIPSQDKTLRLQPSVLPARVADNLFWLGRYIERAEAVVRLWRAHHVRLAEATAADEPLLARITAHLAGRGISAEAGIVAAIGPVVSGALTSAGHVRDRFSADGWLALDELDQTLAEIAANAQPGDETVHAMGELLRKINGFSGLVHENMYRFTGWRFLSIGRALERAGILIETLSDFADPAAPDGSLDLATETADSTITHRRRYASAPSRASVVDLLALDPLNPRALLYQLNEITTHLSFLPGGERHRQLPPLQRALLHLQSSVATSTPEALDTQALQHLLPKITGLSELIGEAYFV